MSHFCFKKNYLKIMNLNYEHLSYLIICCKIILIVVHFNLKIQFYDHLFHYQKISLIIYFRNTSINFKKF